MIGKGRRFRRTISSIYFTSVESVKWPKPISPDMRSFLEGLLTKDSTQRLTWPDLLQHPFVRTGVKGTMLDRSFVKWNFLLIF